MKTTVNSKSGGNEEGKYSLLHSSAMTQENYRELQSQYLVPYKFQSHRKCVLESRYVMMISIFSLFIGALKLVVTSMNNFLMLMKDFLIVTAQSLNGTDSFLFKDNCDSWRYKNEL
jgi:hypothetical protein